MTRLLPALVLLAAASLVPRGNSWAEELEPIGVLPKLDADWEISVDDQQSTIEAKSPFRWVVFRNKRTGDLLSFATFPSETKKKRDMEYWSDTSLEVFPNGRPVWTQLPDDTTINVIRIKVVDASKNDTSLSGEEVLEYCFISESPGRNNLMAQGRAWAGQKAIVFAQHTSAQPITSELIHRTVKSLIRDQRKVGAPVTKRRTGVIR